MVINSVTYTSNIENMIISNLDGWIIEPENTSPTIDQETNTKNETANQVGKKVTSKTEEPKQENKELSFIKPVDGEISKDYYEELIQTRKKYKEEKMKESDV